LAGERDGEVDAGRADPIGEPDGPSEAMAGDYAAGSSSSTAGGGTDGVADGRTGALVGDYAVADGSASSSRGGGGRGRKVAMAVIGVIALLATGVAITQFLAADGAASPEAAVQAFFDAVDDEDALGVLESLAPSEREVLVPSVQALADQLTDLDVAGDDLDLEKVGGLDIQIKDLELRMQGLHPNVAAVKITGGTIATSATFRDLPMGKVLDAALEEQDGRDLDETVKGSEPLNFTLAAVKGDEGWHVSLLYSIAEAERVSDGSPVPDFGNGIPARGADSPRAAVDAMVAAFNEGDSDRMIELTPADTMAVLHDYGPGLLVDDTGDEEDDGSASRLEDVKLGEPEGSGATRRLPLEGYRYVERYDDEETSIVYDGSCITFDFSGDLGEDAERPVEPQRECLDGSGRDENQESVELFGEPAPFGPLLFGPGTAEVVVVERGGAWYVDPSRSLIDSMLLNLERMSPSQVDRMVEYWAAVASGDDEAFYGLYGFVAYEDCPGVEPPPEDATFEERKAAALRCEEESFGEEDGDDGQFVYEGAAAEDECSASSQDEAEVEACLDELGIVGGDEPVEESFPEDACYESDDRAEVEACITALGDPEALQEFRSIACYDGEDDAAIEACLQGLGDPSLLGEFHEDACYDSDDEAAIEACLQDLVDKGELDPQIIFEFRCGRVYDDVGDGDMTAADEAFDRCMADATKDSGG
jgi:hypothetical protein